jgi:hypothetical protein
MSYQGGSIKTVSAMSLQDHRWGRSILFIIGFFLIVYGELLLQRRHPCFEHSPFAREAKH